jgi:putative membrane protein
MMWGYGYGWLAFLWNIFWIVFWIGLLSLVIWALVHWFSNRGVSPFQPWTRQPPAESSAMELLRQRYARGEIDAATFDQMRERLEASYHPKEPPFTAST